MFIPIALICSCLTFTYYLEPNNTLTELNSSYSEVSPTYMPTGSAYHFNTSGADNFDFDTLFGSDLDTPVNFYVNYSYLEDFKLGTINFAYDEYYPDNPAYQRYDNPYILINFNDYEVEEYFNFKMYFYCYYYSYGSTGNEYVQKVAYAEEVLYGYFGSQDTRIRLEYPDMRGRCLIMCTILPLTELEFNAITLYQNPNDTNAYNNGYFRGFNDGYNDGRTEGIEIGYQNAYDQYYTSRYQQGYNDGYTAGSTGNQYTFARLFGAIADTPIMIIRNLLGFDVFGVSAMTILMSMITGCIAIFLIRKFIF